LKSRRTRQDSATDDVQLRHRRHDNRHDAVSVSRTRQERARLGLRDKLDELRLHDEIDHHPSGVSRGHSAMTSYDVTVTPRPRSGGSPDVVTSRRKDLEVTSVAAADNDDDDDDNGSDKKPPCAVTSSLDVTSSMTSHRCGAAHETPCHLSTPGIWSFMVSFAASQLFNMAP